MDNHKLRVGIIFGGRSGEHEVSLVSARAVMDAIDKNKYEVVPLGITREGRWLTRGEPMRELTAAARLLRPAAGLQPSSGPEAISDLEAASSLQAGGREGGRLQPRGRRPRGRPRGNADPAPSNGKAEAPSLPVVLRSAPPTDRRSEPVEVDVIFPILHGPYGEDGTVQGLLELANIPYVGAGVMASAVGMDKAIMKAVFRQAGIPTVDYLVFLRSRWERAREEVLAEVEAAFGYPCFVKPANLGSSVGISKAHDRQEMVEALDTAARYDRKLIVERAVDARDVEVSVLGNDDPVASVPAEILPAREFYDYQAKYLDERTQLAIPADLPPETVAELRRLAVLAFTAIDCAGFARVDFLVDRHDGTVYVNEINTIPGLTPVSAYPKLWEACGISFTELIDRLIQLALERYQDKSRNCTSCELR